MLLKLPAQLTLRQGAAGEDDQTARFFVDSMHDPQAWQFVEFLSVSRGDGPLHPILKGRGELSSLLAPLKLRGMPDRVQT
jgi:hypothetical protein